MSEPQATESWLSRRVKAELKGLASTSRSNPRIVIAFAVVLTLIALYFIAHQLSSTGFFTPTFGPFEMLLLYGSLGEWIGVAFFEAVGLKNVARDIDAFGGIIFVTFGGLRLCMVFPFEFTYFADVLPDYLRFLLQWISNDIARVIIALWTIGNGVAAVYYGILRVMVRKAFSARKSV